MTYQPKIYRKVGATALVAASGGSIEIQSGGTISVEAGGAINVSAGSITLPANLKRGFIPLDLFSGRILSSGENFNTFNVSASGVALPTGSVGGLIGAGTVPFLATFSTAAKAAHVGWASGQEQVLALPPVPIPPDFSSAGGLSIHAMAERSSDNASNNVLDFRFWNSTNATNKGTTGATMTSTPAEYSVVVSSAEAGAHPGFWNFHIVPGTHTNNAVRLFSLWAEYDRRSS